MSVTWEDEWAEPAPGKRDLLAEPRVTRWERLRLRIAEGEIPAEDEWVDPPVIRPGVTVRSASMRRSDPSEGGPFIGRGGIVWQRADDRAGWETVESYRGQIVRYRVADDDIDWESYRGIVRVDVLEGLRRDMGREIAKPRSRHNISILSALAVITSILENPVLQSNTDDVTVAGARSHA